MKCPICGKDLELQKKQVGTAENGDPVFNEYAICRDCRKQWNLDKQRAKKMAAKKAEPKVSTATQKVAEPSSRKAAEPSSGKAAEPSPKKAAEPSSKKAGEYASGKASEPSSRKAAEPSSGKTAEPSSRKKPASASGSRKASKPSSPASASAAEPAKKPVKKRRPKDAGDPVQETNDEKRYSNIPPEKVRTKREKAVRKGYEDMLATGTIGKPSKKKKSKDEEDTGVIKRAESAKQSPSKKHAEKASSRKPEPVVDEYDDDYYDDEPRFRVIRILLGILSLVGFGYFIYRGFVTGLADTTEGAGAGGTTYIVLALCLLVSALLYFILQSRNTVLAFILPMLFYLGGGVFAFLQRGDDLQLLIGAGACAVLAVISLILAIASRGGDYDDDEYDDAFEDDYADDYDD